MFNPLNIVTKGAMTRARDEYVGQMLAAGGLMLTAKVITKVYNYFYEPIEIEPEVIDAEEVIETGEKSEE